VTRGTLVSVTLATRHTDLKSVLLFPVTVIPSLIPVVHQLSESEHVSCSYDYVERESYSFSATQNFPALQRISYPFGQVHLNMFLSSVCGGSFPPMAQQPLFGQGLIIEDSRPHSDTTHLIGFLWTNDQPVAEPLPCNTQY
jgi:hypothetical protein